MNYQTKRELLNMLMQLFYFIIKQFIQKVLSESVRDTIKEHIIEIIIKILKSILEKLIDKGSEQWAKERIMKYKKKDEPEESNGDSEESNGDSEESNGDSEESNGEQINTVNHGNRNTTIIILVSVNKQENKENEGDKR